MDTLVDLILTLSGLRVLLDGFIAGTVVLGAAAIAIGCWLVVRTRHATTKQPGSEAALPVA